MIKAEDIYKVTNNGLDIILHYYPQARDCVGTNRHFKRRPSEDDASACIKLFGKEGSQQVYKVTDFGDTGTAQSPVDICMYEEGLRFNEAILKLASMYNVTDELNRNVNKPDIRKVPASQDQKDGTKNFRACRSSHPGSVTHTRPPCHPGERRGSALVFGQIYRVCKKSRGNL
ncbi:hypothetical protein NXW89_22600 [Bacteroides thetaiotaomicron]|nr:hypothetical protein [Bacteroides thetaiotaomicron]